MMMKWAFLLSLACACAAIPNGWIGDGHCDGHLNTPEHAFDGGDCCAWSNTGEFAATCGLDAMCDCRIDQSPPTHGEGDASGLVETCETDCHNGGVCANGGCICVGGWEGDRCLHRTRRASIASLAVMNSSPVYQQGRVFVSVAVESSGNAGDIAVTCRRCTDGDRPSTAACTGPLLAQADTAPKNSRFSLFFGTFSNTTLVQCRAKGGPTSASKTTVVKVTSDRRLGLPSLPTRKEVRTLTAKQWEEFASGCGELKRRGIWNHFVSVHLEAIANRLPDAGEERCLLPSSRKKCSNADRNSAHRGPTFLPWHRQLLVQFEGAMRMVLGNPVFTVPYWDWRVRSPSLFSARYLGRSEAKTHAVVDGPFKGWGLKRCIGCVEPHVTAAAVDQLLRFRGQYDEPPYESGNGAFRDILEGFEPYGLHNQMHAYVGGAMDTFRSPEDVTFYLLHSFVDYLWYTWTESLGRPYRPADGDPDAPVSSTPSAKLFPWDCTIGQMLRTIGYAYD